MAAELQENLVAPFKQAGRESVPERVWISIKREIENKRLSPNVNAVKDLIERLNGVFSFPRLVPALMSLVLLVTMGSLALRYQRVKQAQERDQGEYLVYTLESLETLAEAEDADWGTSIEQYFL